MQDYVCVSMVTYFSFILFFLVSKCTLPSSFHYYNKTDESVGDYRFTEYKLCLTNKTNKNTKFTISKVNCAVLDAAIV